MANFDTKMVCEIVGITPTQVHYWDKTGIMKPSVVPASGSGSRRLYSFVDLVQFKVAKSLKDAGLSLQKIRKSLRWLGANYPDIKHPLATLKFLTDGETVFKVSSDKNVIIDTLNSGQIIHSIALGGLIQELKNKAKTSTMKWREKVEYRGREYAVVVEPDLEDGGYVVECLGIPGCFSQGETRDEAVENIKDAIKECKAVLEKKGKLVYR
ncbi:MAG TPA: MerR family transcriptional regulator [Candidatus Tripitaka californicus]|uniref:MerR family transcriptional regulator n=1 Tax=Candidatus Tripitaka californicus TaxID=3367616 RepID=UPI0040263391|nr:MerR family transcriptional regulator [Planctomycetota bacterium]